MATPSQALAVLAELEKPLKKRLPEIERFQTYYRGVGTDLHFASPEFARYFEDRFSGFSDNWCAPVADALAERLEVTGIRPFVGEGDEAKADLDLWRVWQQNELDADSSLGFVDAIIARRTYALVWGNPDDETTPEVTFEHPSQMIVGYAPGSRRKRRSALKMWTEGNEEYATIYLPDEVYKFKRRRNSGALVLPSMVSNQWTRRQPPEDEVWPLPNPMGVVPVVELPNRPFLTGEPLSEIEGAASMQDGINLLWAMLFVAADFASFPQRVVMGVERPKTPILDENGQQVGEKLIDLEKFAVDRLLWLGGKDAKIGEFSAANLEAYTQVIEVAVGHLSARTRTPQHYLVGKMANLSADALTAAETPLVSKTLERQIYLGVGVRELFRLVALAQGEMAKSRTIAAGTVLWGDPQFRSEAQLVDALQKLKDIGFPFEFIAERYGLTPPEVARLVDLRDGEVERLMSLGEGLMDRPVEDPAAA